MATGSLQLLRWVCIVFLYYWVFVYGFLAFTAFQESEVSTVYSVNFAMISPSRLPSTEDRSSEPIGDADMRPEDEAHLITL